MGEATRPCWHMGSKVENIFSILIRPVHQLSGSSFKVCWYSSTENVRILSQFAQGPCMWLARKVCALDRSLAWLSIQSNHYFHLHKWAAKSMLFALSHEGKTTLDYSSSCAVYIFILSEVSQFIRPKDWRSPIYLFISMVYKETITNHLECIG